MAMSNPFDTQHFQMVTNSCTTQNPDQWHLSIVFKQPATDDDQTSALPFSGSIVEATLPRGNFDSHEEVLQFTQQFIHLMVQASPHLLSGSREFIADDGAGQTPPDPPPPGSGGRAEQIFNAYHLEAYCATHLKSMNGESLQPELENYLDSLIHNDHEPTTNHLIILVYN